MSQTVEVKSSPPSKTRSIIRPQVLTQTLMSASSAGQRLSGVRIDLLEDGSFRIFLDSPEKIKPAILERAVDRMYRELSAAKVRIANARSSESAGS